MLSYSVRRAGRAYKSLTAGQGSEMCTLEYRLNVQNNFYLNLEYRLYLATMLSYASFTGLYISMSLNVTVGWRAKSANFGLKMGGFKAVNQEFLMQMRQF